MNFNQQMNNAANAQIDIANRTLGKKNLETLLNTQQQEEKELKQKIKNLSKQAKLKGELDKNLKKTETKNKELKKRLDIEKAELTQLKKEQKQRVAFLTKLANNLKPDGIDPTNLRQQAALIGFGLYDAIERKFAGVLPDINANDKLGRTALHNAAINGDKEMMERLTAAGAIDSPDPQGYYAIHHAALNDHKDLIKTMVADPAYIETKGPKGITPLHLAAQYGHKDTVNALLESGADIGAKDAQGRTAIHFATNKATLNYLEKKGLDPHEADGQGKTALSLAVERSNAEMMEDIVSRTRKEIEQANTNIKKAIELSKNITDSENKDLQQAEQVKKEQEANLKKLQNSLDSAFHAAAKNKDVETCNLLIENGANPNAKDINGKTPLALAIENGDKTMIDNVFTQLENHATKQITDIEKEIKEQGSLKAAIESKAQEDISISVHKFYSEEQKINEKKREDLAAEDKALGKLKKGIQEKQKEYIKTAKDGFKQKIREAETAYKNAEKQAKTACKNAKKAADKKYNEEKNNEPSPLDLRVVMAQKRLSMIGENEEKREKLAKQINQHKKAIVAYKERLAELKKEKSKAYKSANNAQKLAITELKKIRDTALKQINEDEFFSARNEIKQKASEEIEKAESDSGTTKTGIEEAAKGQIAQAQEEHTKRAAEITEKEKKDLAEIDTRKAGLETEKADRTKNAKAYLNTPDKDGCTPLHLAVKKGNKELVDRLILEGADNSLKDTKGKTPLDFAIENGNADMALAVNKAPLTEEQTTQLNQNREKIEAKKAQEAEDRKLAEKLQAEEIAKQQQASKAAQEASKSNSIAHTPQTTPGPTSWKEGKFENGMRIIGDAKGSHFKQFVDEKGKFEYRFENNDSNDHSVYTLKVPSKGKHPPYDIIKYKNGKIISVELNATDSQLGDQTLSMAKQWLAEDQKTRAGAEVIVEQASKIVVPSSPKVAVTTPPAQPKPVKLPSNPTAHLKKKGQNHSPFAPVISRRESVIKTGNSR